MSVSKAEMLIILSNSEAHCSYKILILIKSCTVPGKAITLYCVHDARLISVHSARFQETCF